MVDVSGEEGEIVSQLDLQETVLATPSISNGSLYLRRTRASGNREPLLFSNHPHGATLWCVYDLNLSQLA